MPNFTPRKATPKVADTCQLNTDVAQQALHTLRSNSKLNFAARLLLMLIGLGASVLAVVYIYKHADATVATLQSGAGSAMLGERLLVLSAPVLLLAMFAGLAAVAVAFVHSRGIDESLRTLDSVNRLRREGEVAVSARGLIVAFEDQLATARRAHTLLLWLGRTLFIVTLGLFVVAALNAAWHGVDLLTVGLGGTSLVGAALAAARKVPRNVAHDVANVIQLQLIVTGAHRQISLLESDAFAALNSTETAVADAHVIVLDIHERIERVVAIAIEQVERYTDPQPESKKGKVIPLPTLRRPRPKAA
jgi:hypothetical protein